MLDGWVDAVFKCGLMKGGLGLPVSAGLCMLAHGDFHR